MPNLTKFPIIAF